MLFNPETRIAHVTGYHNKRNSTELLTNYQYNIVLLRLMAVCLQTLECGNKVNAATFSPDGQWLATGGGDRHIKIWRASGPATGALCHAFDVGSDVLCVAFCPSSGGDRVAAGLYDRTIQLWSVSASARLLTLVGHGAKVISVAFSPRDGGHAETGQTLASVSADWTGRIWSIAGPTTGTCLHILDGHIACVQSIAYSPNGSRLITSSYDHMAKVWSAATGACLKTLNIGGLCCSAAFSPDGRVIAVVSSMEVWLLDADTGAILHTLRGHTGWIDSMAFAPNGSLLVTGVCNGTAKLWCAAGTRTGDCIATLGGHHDAVVSVAVSPSGNTAITASWDGTVRLWGIPAFSHEARVLVLVLIGRRRRGKLPHVPQELWHMVVDEFLV